MHVREQCIQADTGIAGDYAVDLNLVGVQDAKISITDCKFIGDCGAKAAVKITQRGSATGSDDISDDIEGSKSATIASLEMSGNTFSCVDTPVHIMLGSRMKEGAGGKTYTSSFPVKIESEGSTIVSKSTDIEKYLSIDLNDGALLTSTARIVNLSYARIDNESLI